MGISVDNRIDMIFTIYGKWYPSYYHKTVGQAWSLPYNLSGIPIIVYGFSSHSIGSPLEDFIRL